jgi:hypothetical protein
MWSCHDWGQLINDPSSRGHRFQGSGTEPRVYWLAELTVPRPVAA